MTITCRLISETVAKSYGVTVRDLNSRRKGDGIILPRHMSWTLARRLTERSYPEIGRFMGGRDHTSIIHGVRRIEKAISTDPQIAANYAQLVDVVTVLGEASDKSDRIAVRFHDIDPLETAEAFLEAKFRDFIPSLEAIRALCMGVLHYVTELDHANAMLAQAETELEQARSASAAEAAAWQGERSGLEGRVWELAVEKANADSVLRGASTVVARFKTLLAAETTINERPARKALEASLKTLQTTFERI
ncbi:hypothetical protein HB780_06155 (plasmid) [Rhizobium lusitanum]|uniref:helix-turn-helix domain-containing protein n=1 Tax=Rhizobium lusitanum TaxID=293958 RepID=UPI00161450A4|nr:helix-turn-helix domain-containing protein [Rhizobium lusitanum]QND45329.1 hypothetical protein HB780_06155 [Rhizobium lusitanum]